MSLAKSLLLSCPSGVGVMGAFAIDEPTAGASRPRIMSLDVLRGTAVLGILLINIMGMGRELDISPYYGHEPGPAGGWDPADQVVWWISQIFVEGTMRGLFTLLFGAGFIIFCSRTQTSSGRSDVRVLYLRRIFWLFVFGLVHMYVLLWPGETLAIYGIAGLALLPFLQWQPRSLFLAGGAVLLATALWSSLDASKAAADDFGEPTILVQGQPLADLGVRLPDGYELDVQAYREEILARRGGLSENLRHNFEVVNSWTFDWSTFWWVLDAIGLMLIGAALMKSGIISADRPERFYAKLALVGYAVGVPINLWETITVAGTEFQPTFWPEITYQIGRIAVTAGHLGLLLFIVKRRWAPKVQQAIAAVGRMALTNYIGQTVIAVFIFSGFGLGLYACMERVELWALAVGIWVAQIAFSSWWLTHHAMGPLEALWRRLTYGQPRAAVVTA